MFRPYAASTGSRSDRSRRRPSSMPCDRAAARSCRSSRRWTGASSATSCSRRFPSPASAALDWRRWPFIPSTSVRASAARSSKRERHGCAIAAVPSSSSSATRTSTRDSGSGPHRGAASRASGTCQTRYSCCWCSTPRRCRTSAGWRGTDLNSRNERKRTFIRQCPPSGGPGPPGSPTRGRSISCGHRWHGAAPTLSVGFAGLRVERIEHALERDATVTAVEQPADDVPVDRTVHPDADPPVPAERRGEELTRTQQLPRRRRRHLERDRGTALDDFERAEGLRSGAEHRMAPRRALARLRQREAQLARALVERPLEHRRVYGRTLTYFCSRLGRGSPP